MRETTNIPIQPLDTAPIVREVDAAIAAFVAAQSLPANLDGAVRYALLGGGKRLRPVLAWLCAQSVGGDGRASLAAGVGVELIHAFSLVHDDLPAMDDDALRRGRATLHIHAGEAMAILAGDAMMSLAFAAITQLAPEQHRAVLIEELVSGTTGMISGQVYDTLGGLPDGLDARAQLELIHTNKTGMLIRASCRMGAMLGGADDGQLEAITRYADAIGLQFQVVDDLLDAEGCAEAVGKATGKDAAAGKLTYPGAFGGARSRAIADELFERAVDAIGGLGAAGGPLVGLAKDLTSRTR